MDAHVTLAAFACKMDMVEYHYHNPVQYIHALTLTVLPWLREEPDTDTLTATEMFRDCGLLWLTTPGVTLEVALCETESEVREVPALVHPDGRVALLL